MSSLRSYHRRGFILLLLFLTGSISAGANFDLIDSRVEAARTVTRSGSAGKIRTPLFLEFNKQKRGCCGSVRGGISPFALSPEYETYKLTGTYYTLRENLAASLMLNNKGPEPILATPTFYSLAGTRLLLEPITVPAASYIDVDMHQLLANAGDEFREGSLKIAYQGGDYQLGAQVKLSDQQHNLIWAEQLVYTSKFTSSRLENVWWLPYQNSITKVVVSNTSAGTVTATLSIDGTSPQQSAPVQVSLAPWETRVLDIMQDIAGHPNGHVHEKGGISIEHTGSPGAVLARMYVGKPNRGYSASIPFIDPENTGSQKWHGNGLRLKNLNGTTVRPVIIARNTSDQPSTVSGRIPYTLPNGEMAEVTLPSTVIAANSTRVAHLSNLIQTSNVPASVTYAGIELEYSTPKGTVITAVQSISQDGDHVFQVPIFDPQKMPSSAGGFPWKADGDYTTVVYIKNETSTPKKYSASLLFGGGPGYTIGVKEIKAGQTVEIDFRRLRDEQTPDPNGNLIPLNIESGQIGWSVHGADNKTLSGRSEQISLQNGFASTYACANCCPNRYFDSWLTPVSVFTEIGEVTSLIATQRDQNCVGQIFPPYTADVSFWDSTDWAVASVYNGSTTGQGGGSASIQASWEATNWWYESERCDYIPVPVMNEAPVDVAPRITSITPEMGSVGGKISVSIDGEGFTPSTTIVPISGITFSNIERHGTTGITVQFTIAGNATAGNNDVKVMAGGVSSNAKPFFVQIPKKARRDHTASTVVVDPGPGNIVGPFGNTIATGQCGAYRNLKYTLIDQNDEVLNLGMVDEEIGLTVAEVLSDIQVNPPGVPSPSAKTTSTNNVAQFGDILAAYKVPPCTPPFSIVLTQKFKVTVGQTIFNLSTENFLEITRSGPAQWTIVSTNQTP